MKKLLFVVPILFSSCATQSDLINLGVAASMFTAVTTMEDWAPEKVSEQIKEKKIKNREDYEARIAAKLAKKEANEKESDQTFDTGNFIITFQRHEIKAS